MSCNNCRLLLSEKYNDRTLSRQLEAEAPNCRCENTSLGEGSPGKVEGDESVTRIMVSPRDYDPVTDLIAQKPFEKLFANGLSVMRDIGSDKDFIDIVEDNLRVKPEGELKRVMQLCSLPVSTIRSLLDDQGNQKFCVYDQIVPRTDPQEPPVPTHAGVFQRAIKYDVANATRDNRDLAVELFNKFIANKTSVTAFRNHLFAEVNEKAANGHYRTSQE